jgi:hypothetical protein
MAGGRSAWFGGADRGESVGLGSVFCVGVGVYRVAAGAVLRFDLAKSRVVVAVAVPVRGWAAGTSSGATADSAVGGLRGPGLGQTPVAVVCEALVVGLAGSAGRGRVEDGGDIAGVVVAVRQFLQFVGVAGVGDFGGLEPVCAGS